jgi:hypothetical protein
VPTTADDIADDLRQAWTKGPLEAATTLGSWIGPDFELHHNPPTPNDGLRPGPAYAEDRANQVKAFLKAMPDYHEKADISTQGDEITVSFTMAGTLPDDEGDVLLNVRAVYTVADGKIVKAVAHTGEGGGGQPRPLDPSSNPVFKALSLGGYEGMSRLRPAQGSSGG